MTASERIKAAREARGMSDPLNRLRAINAQNIARGQDPIIERRCFCPDDCNCHYPWRANVCGCKQH